MKTPYLNTAALSIVLFGLFSALSVHAQTPREIFEEKFQGTFNNNTFDNFEESSIEGIYQVGISGEIVYYAPKEELLIFGEIYNKEGISVSEQTRQKWAKGRIEKLDFSDAITIGDGDIEIIEFTDTDCPFCKRFDEWITSLGNEYTFTRKVVATPILQLHPNAEKEAIHLLCQDPKDYQSTLTQLLNNDIGYGELVNCDEGIELLSKHQKIVEELGVLATPTLILNGEIISGFNQERIKQSLANILTENRAIDPNFAKPKNK